MKKLVALLVLASLLGGGYWWFYLRPRQVPNVALKDGAGNVVTLETIRGEKDYLLVVFLLPKCPMSKYSMDLVKGQGAAWSSRMAVAGLLFGTQEQADAFRKDNSLDYPVYGLRSAADPFAVTDLVKTVGSSVGTRDAIFGGTILLLDHQLKVKAKLEKEDTRKLADKVGALLQ